MKPLPSPYRLLLAAFAIAAFALIPALAQANNRPGMGKIHGRVINSPGEPEGGGTVSLSTDDGETFLYDFVVSPGGDYSGQALPAEYILIYRTASTPEGKAVDFIRGVTVMAGLDTKQDVDMSRPEYVNRLTLGQQKGTGRCWASTAAAIQANAIVTAVNADLIVVNQDLQEAATARATASRVWSRGDRARS